MTRVALACAVVALAGCGGSSSHQATVTRYVTQTLGSSGPLARHAVPPPLFLHARAGVQRAVQGSSCVNYTDPTTGEGTGVCADTAYPHPRRLTVVRPGEHVRLELAGAEGFTIAVHPLDCERRTLRKLAVMSDGRWTVPLGPGLYELLVSVRNFHAGARDGDTSGGIGLWVARGRPRRVVPVRPIVLPNCS